jgi:hypothetical protein
MAGEQPTEEETHPVAQSGSRETVARGLMVLLGLSFLVGVASLLYWLF